MKKWVVILCVLLVCMGSACAECEHSLNAETGLCSGCGQTIVAQVEDAYYVSFAQALNDWVNGTILTLHDDVSYTSYSNLSIPAGEVRALHGAAHTIDMVNSTYIVNAGELILTDVVIATPQYQLYCVHNTGVLTATDLSTSGAYDGIYNEGICTVSGGRVHALNNAGEMTVLGGDFGNAQNSGTLTVESGMFTNGSTYTIVNSGTWIMNGGLVINTTSIGGAVWNKSAGIMTMNGGLLCCETHLCLLNDGTAAISGGRLSGEWAVSNSGGLTLKSAAEIICTKRGIESDGTFTMTGGRITAPGKILINNGTANITGGYLTDTKEGVSNSGTMTIGGTAQISGAHSGIHSQQNAVLNVEGGVISGGDYAIHTYGKLNISGGAFEGGIYDLGYNSGTITISAGVPKEGWTIFNFGSGNLTVGLLLKLPSNCYLYDDRAQQTATRLESYHNGVIRTNASNPPAEPEPVAPPAPNSKYKDGIYRASALGFGGDVYVEIVTLDGWIVDVKATGENETPPLGGKALQELSGKIMAANGLENVDAISSATFTSRAVLNAAKECLKQNGTPSTLKLPKSVKTIETDAFDSIAAEVIVIPNGFESIGDNMFANVESLRWIRIPESVKAISDAAFEGCGDFGIWTSQNSCAHRYAVVNGIECRVMPE